MRFQHSQTEEPKVGITALIDIVFLLLIFFMVSTTFDRQGDVQVQLPQANSFTDQADEALDIMVDANGRFWVDGLPVGEPQRANLSQYLRDHPELSKQPVRLRADGSTQHQAVVTVFDLLAEHGFNRVAIATMQGAATP